MQPGSGNWLTDLAVGSRLLAELPSFLWRTITPGPAANLVGRRLARRESDFLELMRWAEGGTCRHDAILRYFGDEAETLAGCGHCDNCTALGEPNDDDAADTATVVRKALSAVARTHRRFGSATGRRG